MKAVIGVMVALLIGAGCRYFGIPSPAPPKFMGALLVMSMCVGYLVADWVLAKAPTDNQPTAVQPLDNEKAIND